MTYDFQVTLDCADPPVLADWCADALGWVVQPSDEDFIRRMIADGYAKEEETTIHRGALVWKERAASRYRSQSNIRRGVNRARSAGSAGWHPLPRR